MCSGITVDYEWEQKKGVWIRYDQKIIDQITKIVHDKSHLVVLVQGSKLGLDLDSMVQKNENTGFVRCIRCTVKSENDENSYIWQWENDQKTWLSFNPLSSVKLEEAYLAKEESKTCSLEICKRQYTIDLAKMEQTNDSTNIVRSIRRVLAVSDPSKSAQPAPPERLTRSLSKRSQPSSANSIISTNGVLSTNGNKGDGPPPPKKVKQDPSTSKKSAAATKKSAPAKSAPAIEKSTKRKVVVKGAAPVDTECVQKKDIAHVFCQGNEVYDAMLNQTNIQNNNNKYYMIQLLEDDNKKVYTVWMRWGRVGLKGQNSLTSCGPDLDQAKKVFCKKFYDKTQNEWAGRKNFKKVLGKYDLLQMDYANGASSSKEENTNGAANEANGAAMKEEVACKLDKQIQALLKMICDVKAMEQAMVELEYDAQKLPLGKLTKTQIKAGYTALKAIEKCLNAKDYGSKLLQACNDYYTRIPHYFGMRQPPLVRNDESLRKEVQLVEALSDIEVAIRTLNQKSPDKVNGHPLDKHYASMGCPLKPIENSHPHFKMIETYVKNTHAPTHSHYKLKVDCVFMANKHDESEMFNDVGNRHLLWHGSRLTNWYGILSQGLCIAPPEAPVTGYMFGKGIYFADMASKSANYCFATPNKNTGLLVLCEVALGKTNDLIAADYEADKLAEGLDSVRGLGKMAPDPAGAITTEDGVIVPLGKAQKTGLENSKGYTLNYNEYVVYNRKQVKMKYLVQVQFLF